MKNRILAIVISLSLIMPLAWPGTGSVKNKHTATGREDGTEKLWDEVSLVTAAVASYRVGMAGMGEGSSVIRREKTGSATRSTEDTENIQRAAAELHEALVARNENIYIEVEIGDYRIAQIAEMVYDEAIRHTGEPDEGDYIVYNGCSWSSSTDYENINDRYLFKIYYYVSYFTDYEQERAVDQEVERILNELNLWNASDYEKICGIYDYLCDNVVYDYNHLENPEYKRQFTAYAALIDKTSACQGYALAFYRLALELGVDTRLITGTSEGVGHAWNIVKLDGLYYNLDSTWDAGNETYQYFLCGSENFPDHTRDARLASEDFLTQYPMSAGSYDPNQSTGNTVASGSCGKSCYWALGTDNVLRITGSGAMEDYASGTAPWSAYQYRIQSVEISEGITGIGSYAFSEMLDLSSISLSNSLTQIGECALSNCISLESITLPQTLKTIGAQAFSGCEKLTTVTVPESVSSIDAEAFANCANLIYAKFLGAAPKCGANIFLNAPSYFCVYFQKGQFGWTSPKWEGYSAAAWSSDVESRMGSCGEAAYWTFTSDGTLVIWGEGEIRIEANDPYLAPWKPYCDEITKIVIAPGIAEIGNGVFSELYNVTAVSLPEGLTRIGWGSFNWCSSLKEVVLPKTLEIIETCAFDNCQSLKSVVIPKSVTVVMSTAFRACTSLTSISVEAGNARYYAMDGVLFDSWENTLLTYPAGKEEKEYDVPDGIAILGNSAFYGSKLVSVSMPDSVVALENQLFHESVALEKVTLSNNIGTIPPWAFASCKNLQSIIIPNGVGLIDYGAFSGCEKLQEVNVPDTVAVIAGEAFNWCVSLKSISIPEGQTIIGQYTFANCHSLEKVTIPSSVQTVEQFAFSECFALQSIVLPEGLTSIANGVFFGSTKLLNITIPKTLSYIGQDAFKNTPWLENAADEDGFVIINDFLYCYQGEGGMVKIPDSVKGISGSAFAYCDNLQAVSIPEGIQTIENSTFYGDGNLAAVYIPASVEKIGWAAFGAEISNLTVYYGGTKAQWEKIEIGGYNESLNGAKIFYGASQIEHNYVAEIVEPTCSEKGYTVYICTICGDSYTGEVTAATGHSYGGWVQVKAPTTTAAGLEERVCGNCGSKEQRTLPKLDPAPTDPAPTDPTPTDPTPTDPAPTDPAPTDPTPTDPAPTDPAPTDPAPTDPAPTDPAPTDPTPNKDEDKVVLEDTVLTPEIIQSALDAELDLVIKQEDYQWTISADQIRDVIDGQIDLSVTLNTENIPGSVLSSVDQGAATIQLSLAHNGEFGFTAELTVLVGIVHAGKEGTLYYYNGQQLERIGSAVIAENGEITLPFTHAADYAIVIEENAKTEQPPVAAIVAVLIGIAAVGFAVAIVIKKRQKQQSE